MTEIPAYGAIVQWIPLQEFLHSMEGKMREKPISKHLWGFLYPELYVVHKDLGYLALVQDYRYGQLPFNHFHFFQRLLVDAK